MVWGGSGGSRILGFNFNPFTLINHHLFQVVVFLFVFFKVEVCAGSEQY